MDKVNIVRKFRGATYNITIENTGSHRRVSSLLVNGSVIEGNIIPYDENIKEYVDYLQMGLDNYNK